MKFLCIGDSLTFGYGLYKNQCWVDLLNINTSHKFINKGCNGDTTSGMLSRFSKELEKDSFDGIFIMGGSNDLLSGRHLNYIEDNLILMVNEALEKNLKVFLLIPPLFFPPLAKKLWSSNIDYENSNKNIKLLKENLTKKFLNNNHIKILDLSSIIPNFESYYLDGIHLTYESNKLIFNNIITTL
ncbi:GDSL-type esterase/lipase family protein [Clostridium fallax]|uniref:Lysophospholipase L1 n=1 Tax=Clostridium fallax TaxID=1533 RepID=A0A1M4WG67_9CLOT|nr:GDSL-type esterase/lipase family protein [Clostridium fallax]SHE79952.1 Lysophospholipase L1 [Clostridium fallax]SQB04943.1 tesA-like protease [Clostridium fallax]